MAMEFIPDETLTPFSPVAHDAASASVAVAAAAAAAGSAGTAAGHATTAGTAATTASTAATNAATSATDAATLVTSQAVRQKRLRTLARLADGIARTGLALPGLAAVVPTIGAPTSGSGIAVGTTWNPNIYPDHYSFMGALSWGQAGPTWPTSEAYVPVAYHGGNGSDPSANPGQGIGPRVRFVTDAPSFEIYWLYGDAFGGFRLRVDGELAVVGAKGHSGEGPANGSPRFIAVTWGDGSATYRQRRHYDIEFASNGKFGGIRTGNIYRPSPWPHADALKMMVHGDSMVATITDSGTHSAWPTSSVPPVLGLLCDAPDCIPSGNGGTGFIADLGNTRSTFGERAAIDVIAAAPDVIFECGGRNDNASSQATVEAAVTAWLAAVIAALPSVVIFMTGPLVSYTSDNSAAGMMGVRNAKAAAAALYPQNVVFIDNLAEAWANGTGRQGATTGAGNSDYVISTDSTHYTLEGNAHIAHRIGEAAAKRIPVMIAAQLP